MARGGGDTVVLRDVLDIKEDVTAGDFKIELSQGFRGDSAGRVEEYVVTPQRAEAGAGRGAQGVLRGRRTCTGPSVPVRATS
ncbi:hypothetical protein [Streptomyces sp. NPDC055186]